MYVLPICALRQQAPRERLGKRCRDYVAAQVETLRKHTLAPRLIFLCNRCHCPWSTLQAHAVARTPCLIALAVIFRKTFFLIFGSYITPKAIYLSCFLQGERTRDHDGIAVRYSLIGGVHLLHTSSSFGCVCACVSTQVQSVLKCRFGLQLLRPWFPFLDFADCAACTRDRYNILP